MKEQVSGTSVCDVSCLKLVNGRGYNLIIYFAGIRKSYPINAATAQWFVIFLSTWEEAEKDQLLMLMPF